MARTASFHGCAAAAEQSSPFWLFLLPTGDATHTFVVRGQNTGSKIAGRKATSQSMCENGLTLEYMILAE